VDAFPVARQQSDGTEENSAHEHQSGTITYTHLILFCVINQQLKKNGTLLPLCRLFDACTEFF